ncbi:hypothetical protein PLESTB_000593100 [Pleodorina starrii]|uniref:Uncharacterized protein n=1 Tax=Pleodorina starrii TaxID=330485 RepID=A0A9W6BHF8_9CHLO|nr:hypothetical protein PLESTB_000593100 [Pleodorina starrii]
MVAGLMAVGLVKRIINSVPLINILTRPVLDLVPTIVVGPALGAALMYGIEEGDLMAARHVVREKAHRVRQELDVIVQDLSSEIRAEGSELARQLERSQGALESVARAVTDSVSELERTVLPATEREYRRLEAHARQAFQDVGAEGPRGRN